MSRKDPTPAGQLQTITLEFEIQGALDGVTPQPRFSPDRTNPAFRPPEANTQYYPIVVEGNLGLIDPDALGLGDGTMGDRFLQRLELQAATPGGATARIAVADARGIVRPTIDLETFPGFGGSTFAYRDLCVFFPQGSVLLIDGWSASPVGDPHILRVHFVGAESVAGEALLADMCCCEEALSVNGGGG